MYVCAEAYSVYVTHEDTGLMDHNLCYVCVFVCVFPHLKNWILFELVHLGPWSHSAPFTSSGVLWMWFISKQGDPNEDEAGATADVWRDGGREAEREGNTEWKTQ